MAQQQLGFDFFNTPPEEPKPVKEKLEKKALKVPEKDAIEESPVAEQVPTTPELQDDVIVQDKVDESVMIEEADAIEAIPATESPAEKEAAIEVEEEVPEVEFVLVKEKIPAAKLSTITGKKSTRGRMRLSDMDVLVDLVEVPEDAILFQKNYYSIGDVSNMFKVNISLIRFWENEFDILKPKKNGKGDRLFRPQDIKNLQLIYHLLREKKYTIDGAKVFLKKNKKAEETFELIDALKKTKSFLLDLKANL